MCFCHQLASASRFFTLIAVKAARSRCIASTLSLLVRSAACVYCTDRKSSRITLAIADLLTRVRSGHYDILYKQDQIPAPPAPAVVPTYLTYASQPFYEPASDLNVSGMPDFMTLLPGMSYANQAPFCGMPGSYDSYDSASDFGFNSNGKAPVTACTPTPSAPAPQSHVQSQSMFAATSTPVQMVPPPSQLTHDIDVRTIPQLGHSDFGGGPFRPNQYTFDSAFASHSQPFQTSIFRKWVSH